MTVQYQRHARCPAPPDDSPSMCQPFLIDVTLPLLWIFVKSMKLWQNQENHENQQQWQCNINQKRFDISTVSHQGTPDTARVSDIEWWSPPTHPRTIPGVLEAISVLEQRRTVGERINLFLTFFNLYLTFFCTKSRKKARIIYIKKIQNYIILYNKKAVIWEQPAAAYPFWEVYIRVYNGV